MMLPFAVHIIFFQFAPSYPLLTFIYLVSCIAFFSSLIYAFYMALSIHSRYFCLLQNAGITLLMSEKKGGAARDSKCQNTLFKVV